MEDVTTVTITIDNVQVDTPANTSTTASIGVQPANHADLTDYELLTTVTGERPLSTRLHLIRDKWIDHIMTDIKQMEAEAERFMKLSRRTPVGSRTWRLLREEADRVETQYNLTRGQLTLMRRAPGPYVLTEDTGNEAGDGSFKATAN